MEQQRNSTKKFKCSACGKTFASKSNLIRHTRNPKFHIAKSPSQKFHCFTCNKEFPSKQNLQRHLKLHGQKRSTSAPKEQPVQSTKVIDTILPRGSYFTVPRDPTETSKPIDNLVSVGSPNRTADRNLAVANAEFSQKPDLDHIDQAGWQGLKLQKKAFEGTMASYRIIPSKETWDSESFLQSIESDIEKSIHTYLSHITGVKLQLSLSMQFYKPTDSNERTDGHFCSLPVPILQGDNANECINNCFTNILDSHEMFVRNGSGWVDHQIHHIDVLFFRYQPLRAGCHVELPKNLRDKKAILNIKNTDDKCFLWCIIAADRLDKVASGVRKRVTSYVAYEKDYKICGIRFPVALQQVKQFEKQNEVSINVFGYETGVIPLYISKYRFLKHVNLFLLKGHYFLITRLDRLLSDQRGGKYKKHFCHRCLFPCKAEEKLEEHLAHCSNTGSSIVQAPNGGKLTFKNVQRMQRRPLILYCDFECLTTKIDQSSLIGQEMKPNFDVYQRHVPCGYALVESVNCCGNAEMKPPRTYRGPDCVLKFLVDVVGVGTRYQEDLDNAKGLTLTKQENLAFIEALQCHICRQNIVDSDIKVRDHCHLCGKYRGAAHSTCNLNYRLDRDITVVFHNLRRYDGHLIMQKIGEASKMFGMTVNPVAKSMEDYLSFTLIAPADKGLRIKQWRIRFIDSYLFLSTSLDSLAKALPKEKFKCLREMCRNDKEFELLTRKGVYPYDYMDSWDRFQDTKLPEKPQFYNVLTESDISDEDYDHAKQVWKQFRLKNMGEYHDLYLTTDVLILHDVFEEFRRLVMDNYGLDPPHYITLPSMAWDACLKLTRVELELIQDPNMYAFFERGIRGGVSIVSKRYAKANNHFCEDFDRSKPSSYIVYLDANNLYGWAMTQCLPTGGFRWMTEQEIQTLTPKHFEPNQVKGYALEVDLEYPAGLHAAHSDYPLAPEKMEITEDMLSSFCSRLKKEFEIKSSKVEKLVPNVSDKRKYVIHSWQLHLCLELGLKLTKIHRAVEFTQNNWMKRYIMLNTELRKDAKTEFEQSMFKLMNNAVFGKTMENTRLYQEIKLATTKEQAIKLIKSPRFKQGVVFNENLAGLAMTKKFIKLNKPIYVGFSVLEISKILMYEFHYKKMISKYGESATLLFTDTDSLMYEITTGDIYKDMKENLDLYDTSNYPIEHPLYSEKNKKVPGKMKDETIGKPISHFVGLKSKMYSFLCDGEEKKRAKGVKRSTVQKHISFAQYLDCVFQHSKFKHDMKLIRSKLHQLYSESLTRTSLTPFDDKRYILDDGINSLPYGHCEIEVEKSNAAIGNKKIAEAMDYDPGCSSIQIGVEDD